MKLNLLSRLCLLAAALGPVVATMGADLAAARQTPAILLADQGHAGFSIVIPSKPSPTEAFAAQELRRYLSAISGAPFEVGSNRTAHSILVCRRDSAPAGITLPSGVARLPAEGYCLAARDPGLLLVGADDRGTLYAVYDLLDRLGCRWLAPDFAFYQGAHETVPKAETLSLLLKADVLEQPVLKYRKLCVEEGHTHNTTNLLQMVGWMPKRRFNTLVVPLNYAGGGRVVWDNWRQDLIPELRRRGLWIEVGGHGYENYLNAAMEDGRLFERHPEWFHLDENGKRVRNARAVFCTANREAKDYFIRSVIRYLDAHPEIQIFDFWPPDGAKWCHCAECKGLGAPSDRQALLLGEVSAAVHKTRPDLRFETIAYAACVAPPVQAAMDPGVLVDFCPIGQCFEAQINDPASDKNAAYVAQLRDWTGSFKGDLSLYSYYRKYAWRSLPNLIPHYIQKQLRISLALALGSLFVLAPIASAQTTNQPVLRPAAVAKGQRGTTGPLEMMKQSLKLSDEQVRKLEPVLKEHLDKISALRRDTSLSRQDRVARLKEMQTALDTKIKQHLTPEQAEKWQKARLNRQAVMQQPGQAATNGSPFSVRGQGERGQQPRPSWQSPMTQP